jgi:hypothetical protein
MGVSGDVESGAGNGVDRVPRVPDCPVWPPSWLAETAHPQVEPLPASEEISSPAGAATTLSQPVPSARSEPWDQAKADATLAEALARLAAIEAKVQDQPVHLRVLAVFRTVIDRAYANRDWVLWDAPEEVDRLLARWGLEAPQRPSWCVVLQTVRIVDRGEGEATMKRKSGKKQRTRIKEGETGRVYTIEPPK